MASQPNKPQLQSYEELLASGFKPIASPAPMINGQPARPIPAPPVSSMNRVLVGTLPSEMQLDADFAENQYGGQVPVYRLMPPASSGKAAVNAAAQSTQIVVQQGGGSGPTLETNGINNSRQDILNLQSGANIALTPDSNGNVRVDAGSSSGFTLLPEGTATSIQNFDSNPLTFEASYWNGSSPAIDSWSIQLFPGSNPLSSGTDLIISHNTLNGAGRFHIDSDMLIGPPLSATSSQNSNSFAWDVEGSYWDGTQTQFAIWEQALGIEPASGDVGLNARLSLYPLFTGAAGTGDIAIGGTGVNPLQGYPVAHSYWILKAFPVSDGHTATLEHTAFTADRTFTFPDATGTLATLENPQTFSGQQTFSDTLNAPGVVSSGTSVILEQTGDLYGPSSLTMESRNGANGAVVSGNLLPLVEFVLQAGPNIASTSVSGNVVTINFSQTMAVAFSVGNNVYCQGLTTSTFLNGIKLVVTAASTIALTANFTHADYVTTNDTGKVFSQANVRLETRSSSLQNSSNIGGEIQFFDGGTGGTGIPWFSAGAAVCTISSLVLQTAAIESSSANPANTGTVRMAVSDVISWRNNANSGNLRLGVDAGDNLELVGGFNGINLKGNNLSQVTNLQSDSANIAHSGFIEMAASDAIAWRNNANSADVSLAKDTSDRLTFGGNTVSSPVYNAAGTLQNAAHVVQDTVTLVGGTATVTLSGSAAFSSATSYSCVAIDETSAAAVKVMQTSGTSITFTGTGTDVIRFIAVGN